MNWILPDKRLSASLLEHVLLSRGLDKKHHQKFLNPSRDQIVDPATLFDSEAAAEVILKSVDKGEKVFIHGDYDVDGVSSTAILWDFLYRKLGADVMPLIPSRFTDGYGLSESTLEQMVKAGADLVITVDCGIRDSELISKYKQQGLKFIVTDHHTLPDDESMQLLLDSCEAVVHPDHPLGGGDSEVNVCAAMVAWKLCRVIARKKGIEDQLDEYLDLVALATSCDLMPMVGENRSLVKIGLDKIRTEPNLGLAKLSAVAGVALDSAQSYQFGYVLGPRINAAGRLESAMDALRLLTTNSPSQADELASKLHSLNLERQDLTKKFIREAKAQIQSEDSPVIFVYGEDWPEGVVGLVAGRLAEEYYRPAFAASLSDGVAVGSARSPLDFHLANALNDLSDLLERYGGHAQAAGFTVKKENIEQFKKGLINLAQSSLGSQDFEKKLTIEAVLESRDLVIEVADQLAQLEPIGMDNPAALGAILGAELTFKQNIGKDGSHVRGEVLLDGVGIKFIHFNSSNLWSGIVEGDTVDLAGYLEVNEWNGNRSVQFRVREVRVV